MKTITFSAAVAALAFISQVACAEDSKKGAEVLVGKQIKANETTPAEPVEMKCPKCKTATAVTTDHDHGAIKHDHAAQKETGNTTGGGKSVKHDDTHKCCDTKSASTKGTKK